MTDPDANLRKLRELFSQYMPGFQDADGYLVDEMKENFEALDEWLTEGNTLPSAWGFAVPPLVIRMED